MSWIRFWMSVSGTSAFRRFSASLADLATPPYKARSFLAQVTPKGYVSPRAEIHCSTLRLGRNVFVGDGVIIYQDQQNAGPVNLGDRVHLHRDVIVEVGLGGSLSIGEDTHVQPRCQFSAYEGSIQIGRRVMIAPYCAFYPYNHGTLPGYPMALQPLKSKGGIVIGNESWLGVGVIVPDGVHIGQGAVIGAGSVVTRDVPDGCFAAGSPARVVKMRAELPIKEVEAVTAKPGSHQMSL